MSALDQWTEGREIGPVEYRIMGSRDGGYWLESRFKDEQDGRDWSEWEEVDVDLLDAGGIAADLLNRFALYLEMNPEVVR